MIYIRSSQKEGFLFELVTTEGKVLREYNNIVNFEKEIEKYKRTEEKVDEEKAAMAEAIVMLETQNIDLENRLLELESKITGGTI